MLLTNVRDAIHADHISDVREELGWLTARQLYELQSLSLLHKISRTREPQALASQLSVNSELRSRSTRQDFDLALPHVRTNAGKRRFLYSIVQQYNNLPIDMRESDAMHTTHNTVHLSHSPSHTTCRPLILGLKVRRRSSPFFNNNFHPEFSNPFE